jgi:uncharacterized membrane protein YfcA
MMVDLAWLVVHAGHFALGGSSTTVDPPIRPRLVGLVAAASLSAFLGSFVGTRLLPKVTVTLVQRVVAAGLVILGLALETGVV